MSASKKMKVSSASQQIYKSNWLLNLNLETNFEKRGNLESSLRNTE
jgi:hypothetical protein